MRFAWIVFLSFGLAGCAASVVYNPMQVASQQELLLNESGLKALQIGMSLEDVHKIMGTELVIGYAQEGPNYKPMTIANPYKTQSCKEANCTIEYYVDAIRQPDGVVSDNELLPLVFKDNKLIGRGWPLANSLHPVNTSA